MFLDSVNGCCEVRSTSALVGFYSVLLAPIRLPGGNTVLKFGAASRSWLPWECILAKSWQNILTVHRPPSPPRRRHSPEEWKTVRENRLAIGQSRINTSRHEKSDCKLIIIRSWEEFRPCHCIGAGSTFRPSFSSMTQLEALVLPFCK